MKLRFNPFKPGAPFPPEIFKGRLDELSFMIKSLHQAKHGEPQCFILEGERGIGKSSLFLVLQFLAKGEVTLEQWGVGKFNFLVINEELTSTMQYSDILKRIASALSAEARTKEPGKASAQEVWDWLKNWEILGVKYKSEQQVAPSDFELFEQLAFGIEKIFTTLSSSIDGILILLDEADTPSETAKLGEIIKLLGERLTKKNIRKVSFGLAGLPTLKSKIRQGHEASLRIFHTMDLEPLKFDERLEIIDACIAEAEQINGYLVDITDEAKREIATISEGYPHFLQQFGYSSFDEDTDNMIDLTDVKNGLSKPGGALEQLGHKYFEELYFDKIGSDDYRSVLNAFAEFSDSWVSRAQLIEKAGLKDVTVNNALRALKERNIILTRDGARGEYRLPTKSFAIWIKLFAKTWVPNSKQEW